MNVVAFIFCFAIFGTVLCQPNDPQRPAFHFLPEENWMNDPNGMFYFNGNYHVFYQYATTVQPTEIKYWGHAVSKDLVTWQRLPIGLSPDTVGADNYGIWSGSAIVSSTNVIMSIYTGINKPSVNGDDAQTVCLAFPVSNDGLLPNWYKYKLNPVIPGPPDALRNNLVSFRDPCIWEQQPGVFYFILGSGIQNKNGATLIYKSNNMTSWTYQGIFLTGNPNDGGTWECPDYFTLPTPDGKTLDCLFVSIDGGRIAWKVGHTDLEKMVFLPISGDAFRYDVGWNYAPRSFYDPVKKRQIQFGWLNEGRSSDLNQKEGWAGVMTLAREIYVRPDYTLGFRPIAEQTQLRKSIIFSMSNFIFPTNFVNWNNIFREVKGNQLEFIANFTISKAPKPADRFGLILLADPLLTEYTRIVVDLSNNIMAYNLTRGSYNSQTDHSVNQLSYQFSSTLILHGFVDHSVIEVFVNEQIVLTPRVYPEGSDALHMGLFYEQVDDVEPSGIILESLVVYEVASVW